MYKGPTEKSVQGKALTILKKNGFQILFSSLEARKWVNDNDCAVDIVVRKNGRRLPIEVKGSLFSRLQTRWSIGQCLFYYFKIAQVDPNTKNIILLCGDREGFEETRNVIDMFDLPIDLVDMKEFEVLVKANEKAGEKS
jgi:hypothetical protein